MRKHLLAATATLALLASCTKETTNVVVNAEPYRPPFRVSGVSDVVLEKTPFGFGPILFQMPLQVTYIHGEAQRVALQFSGMPQGIRDSLTIASGYPDFSTFATFFYESAANGVYPAKLGAKADTGKLQEYGFNITVKGDTSCSGFLAGGSYSSISFCDASRTPYPVTITKNGRGGDTLFVNNFQRDNTSLMCKIDCRASSIIIPTQIIGGSEYSGGGNIQASSFGGGVSLNLFVQRRDNGGPISISCNYFLTRN